MPPTSQQIIDHFNLTPHPEGGYFRETFRDNAQETGRAASTAIYFLLAAGEQSHWHRVDAAEAWHYYAGAPLHLSISEDQQPVKQYVLGTDFLNGQQPQAIVPAHAWQAAKTLGDWTLLGCTVAPGFEFSGFELAPPEWVPS